MACTKLLKNFCTLLVHNMYMADYLFNQMKEMTETQSYESIRVNLSSCFYLLNCKGGEGQRIGFFVCLFLLLPFNFLELDDISHALAILQQSR